MGAIGDWTVSELRERGRGEGSDTPFVDAIWVVARVRDGKVVRWQTFASETEAVEATEPEMYAMCHNTHEPSARSALAFSKPAATGCR